jgi:predicted flap endonuclease-1-like 5' DNA nuclease
VSLYTAFEIAAWLVAAAGVGCVIGWLLSLARRDEALARDMDTANARARGAAAEIAARAREVILLTEQAQRIAIEGRETAGALRVQLAAAQDHRDQARSGLADVRADFERQRAEGRAQGEQLERISKQLSDARGAIDHLTGECTNAQRLLAGAEVERDQAVAELSIKRAALSRMTKLQGQRDRAVGQADALSLRLDGALARRAQAEDNLATARSELGRAQQRLSMLPGEMSGFEPDAAALVASRTERDALAERVKRLEGLYAKAIGAKTAADNQITSLTRALEVERIDHSACRATLTAVSQERNHLRALHQSSMVAPAPAPEPADEQGDAASENETLVTALLPGMTRLLEPSTPAEAVSVRPTRTAPPAQFAPQSDPGSAVRIEDVSDLHPTEARRRARSIIEGFGAPDDTDNLRELRGIGAKTAQKLRGLGIVSFAQIAQLEPDAVQVVARAVGLAPDRVLRDNWPAQAQTTLKR